MFLSFAVFSSFPSYETYVLLALFACRFDRSVATHLREPISSVLADILLGFNLIGCHHKFRSSVMIWKLIKWNVKFSCNGLLASA